jgi:hypothetical protein
MTRFTRPPLLPFRPWGQPRRLTVLRLEGVAWCVTVALAAAGIVYVVVTGA